MKSPRLVPGSARAPVSNSFNVLATAVALVLSAPVCAQQNASEDQDEGRRRQPTTLESVHVTAAQIARQALGTSTITAEDIERRPPANDIAELLRTMPGVNFTGNSASGQYGNNRQIDLRGMGPENTLVLVDGRPVGSRDSIRMGVSGERNTRGDTNWVPAEAIERIDVLRGPAAARYGSGAAGGVVNIITKKPTGTLTGSLSLYGLVPEHGDEGGSQRAGFNLSGPLARDWSFRLFGNLNKTDADSLALNQDYATGSVPPAGREGVRNKDINGLLRWDPSEDQVLELEAGFSRQGNIYAGDRAVSETGTSSSVADLTALAEAGAETNVMLRRTAAITHRGTWGFGSSRLSLAYEDTDNTRYNEGLAGGPEGSISSSLTKSTSNLRNYSLDGELNIPSAIGGVDNIWTLGFEHRDSRLDDPYSMSQAVAAASGSIEGLSSDRSGRADAKLSAVFVEDNIYLGERLTLTPGLRFDHHSQFGNNLSPSLNAQYRLDQDWSLKGGVARAFKAPNLYQSNPNYLYYTMGNGCPDELPSLGSGCYILGNADLEPETSINKEVGVEWAPDDGYHASLTYFHNDYKNKIVAGYEQIALTSSGTGRVFQWENAPKAIVQGLEGNLKVPLLGERGDVLQWDTNVTYMIENKNKSTGQPLSIIPRYTVNSALDWQATRRLSLLLTATFYGKQEPATRDRNNDAKSSDALAARGAYNIWGLSARYRITRKVSLGLGVNNLADKRLFRQSTSGGAGAATYNEPGRAYWASLNLGF
ncbi:MAG: TonB-dependent siderophore receptor [Pseudomonas sp.]